MVLPGKARINNQAHLLILGAVVEPYYVLVDKYQSVFDFLQTSIHEFMYGIFVVENLYDREKRKLEYYK